MSGIITPKTTKVIPNEGMPIYDKEVERDPDRTLKRGKLVVKFNILFPKRLTEKQKNQIGELFKKTDSEEDEEEEERIRT